MKVKSRHGVAIVVVMLVLGMLAMIGFAVATLGANNIIQAGKEIDSSQALYAAEAGARRKIGEIKANDLVNIPLTPMPTLTDCSYEVSVTPSGGSAPNGLVVPGPDAFYILSSGRSRGGTVRRVGMLVKRSTSTFTYAAFAANRITILGGGSFTDTYNSATGLPGNHALAGIGVNSASAGAVSIDNGASRIGKSGMATQAKIFGPPGSNESTVVASPASNYLAYQQLTSPFPLPAVVSPRVVSPGTTQKADAGNPVVNLTPGDYEVVTVESGAKMCLDVSLLPNNTEANYCFKEFKMTGLGSRLELVTGGKNITCNLYIDDGAFTVEEGSIVNPTSKPGNLQFKVSNGNAKIENFGSAYFVAYNPTGQVSIKSAEVYGSITADDILLEESGGVGGRIHYDEQLATLAAPGFGSVQIVSTQRY